MSGRQIDHRLLRSSSLWRRQWDWSINRLSPVITGALDLPPSALVTHLKPFFSFVWVCLFFLPITNLWILLSTSLHHGFNSSAKKFASEIKHELQFCFSCSGYKSLVTHRSATRTWCVIVLRVSPVLCCTVQQLKQEETHWHAAGLLVQIYSGWRESSGCDVAPTLRTLTWQFRNHRMPKEYFLLGWDGRLRLPSVWKQQFGLTCANKWVWRKGGRQNNKQTPPH